MTRLGNSCVDKNSRTAKKYATPAAARGIINADSPMRLKLRAHIVSEMSKMMPSPYSLRDGERFTGSPPPCEGVTLSVPIPSAKPRFVAPWPERAAAPQRAELNRKLHQCRRNGP